jgi:nitroreductase
MNEIHRIIQDRQSARVPFEPNRKVSRKDLKEILDAVRWAPTAHNMQNFSIIVVDDREILEMIGNVKSRISEVFLRENYEQLSFSKEELREKKTGILGAMFPPSWVDPSKMAEAANECAPMPLTQSIRGSPCLLIVVYDPKKRAPASEGDVLGFMSLGCVMENMWLMASSLGISMQILSTFVAPPVEKQVKQVLGIPEQQKIAYACRLGYPVGSTKYLRVRRDVEDFVHFNKFGNKCMTENV